MIIASFAQQYSVRLMSDDCEISRSEYLALLTGLGPDTPLGRIVSIRAEKDPKIIQNFTENERTIYNEWKQYRRSLMNENNKEKERSQTNKELCDLISAFFG